MKNCGNSYLLALLPNSSYGRTLNTGGIAISRARTVAQKIKDWAVKNKITPDFRQSPGVDDNFVRNAFGRVGVPQVTKILQSRGISYIGVDDAEEKVVIFLEKKINRRDEKLLQAITLPEVTLEFREGKQAHVGPSAPPPIAVPPYDEHHGRYTCGSSVYIGSDKGAGTLGCLVKDAAGHLYGLSNNHVTGGSNYASIHLPIVAPGILDVAAGQKDPETLGHHSRSFPFVDGLPDIVAADANLDAAIFKILNPDRISSMQRNHYDTPQSCVPLKVGMDVQKIGRTTGRTTGRVVAEFFDFQPILYQMDMLNGHMGRKFIFFKSLFGVVTGSGPFTVSGDSGSLVTWLDPDRNRHAVGIVVGGDNEGLSFILSLDRILTHFGIELVSGHNVVNTP